MPLKGEEWSTVRVNGKEEADGGEDENGEKLELRGGKTSNLELQD